MYDPTDPYFVAINRATANRRAADLASLEMDGLVREFKTIAAGGHADHDGWSLTGWPKRELRCSCGDTFFASCDDCGEFVATTPSGELHSHDNAAMMACAGGEA